MGDELFVPEGFVVPDGLIAGDFDHIRATPGVPRGQLATRDALTDNLHDLQRHAWDFAERRGFTYSVLSTGTGDIIGWVYIYPPGSQGPGGLNNACTRPSNPGYAPTTPRSTRPSTTQSYVAERHWPFDSIEYAPRT